MQIEIITVNEKNKDAIFIDVSAFGKTELLQKDQTLFCYIGVGKEKLAAEDLRLLGGYVRKRLLAVKDAEAVMDFSQLSEQTANLKKEQTVSCFLEGWHMAAYEFNNYKKETKPINTLRLKAKNATYTDLDQAAKNKADAVHFARDLCNEPANKLTPQIYAERLKEVFENTDVTVEIIEGEALSATEFPGIHTVAKGSSNPPKLAVLTLNRASDQEKMALVGKGVTFDSGGINAKTGRDISDMKMDMGGSAAVAGTMKLLEASGSKVNVTAILPLVQNISDGNAMLPSDIIHYRNGLHVEVGNTDAEGRLILADGILYAKELGIKKIIDIATLTGSIMRALGAKAAGIFSNDESSYGSIKSLVMNPGTLCGRCQFTKNISITYQRILLILIIWQIHLWGFDCCCIIPEAIRRWCGKVGAY